MTEETPRPRILLVDDDAELLDLMQSRLLALGRFEVMAASHSHPEIGRASCRERV